jgi:predicted nucleic acid-binding protein
VIYLDSCALVKLLRSEAESADLVAWLAERHQSPQVSSVLAEVEMERALRRYQPDALHRLPVVLSKLHRIEIDPTIRAIAAAFPEPMLRSLDAIHLATAQALSGAVGVRLIAFVTYDIRLADIAMAYGMPVAQPGQAS